MEQKSGINVFNAGIAQLHVIRLKMTFSSPGKR